MVFIGNGKNYMFRPIAAIFRFRQFFAKRVYIICLNPGYRTKKSPPPRTMIPKNKGEQGEKDKKKMSD